MEQLLPTSDKPKFKSSITQITFGEYVELAVGNFSLLALSENVNEEELRNARQLILAEFAEATGDLSFIASMQSSAKRMRLGLKLMGLNLSERILEIAYNEDTLKYLKEINVVDSRTKYPETPAELNDIVQKIRAEINLTKLDLSELNALEDKREDDKPELTENSIRKSFVKLLASVSQYVKFNVTYDVNCAQVAEYVNRLRQYQDEQERNSTK